MKKSISEVKSERKHLHYHCNGEEESCNFLNCQTCPIKRKMMADITLQASLYSTAIATYEEILQTEPKYVDAWASLGNAHIYQDNYQEALDCFEEALAVDHIYGLALLGKAVALKGLGRLREAMHTLDKILNFCHDQHCLTIRRRLLEKLLEPYQGPEHQPLLLLWQQVEAGQSEMEQLLWQQLIYDQQDSELGLYLCEAAALKGNLAARLMLGSICEEGNCAQQQDLDKAIYWYKKAADGGLVAAQTALGCLLLRLEKQGAEAIAYLQEAAEKGEAKAFEALGTCYYRGFGTRKNHRIAKRWWRKAAALGNLEAKKNLALVESALIRFLNK